jgi:RNA chaperone Hfq
MMQAVTQQFNLQDHKLNEARKEGQVVTITLMDGSTYTGLVTAFDQFTVAFITPNPIMELMLYKHAISSIKFN